MITITLYWWFIPLGLLFAAVAVLILWPDEGGSHFMAGGPSILKLMAMIALVIAAVSICIGRLLA